MQPRRADSPQLGFSLIEMILVIVLTGAMGAMIAGFIRKPITAYADMERRAELTDIADVALRRIARELQGALPNSVRVNGTGLYIEFMPASAAGRYRAAKSSTLGTEDFLDFSSATDNSFDVLGPTVSVVAGDQLVINNLGLVGADVYAGTSRRALIGSGASLSNLQYTVGGAQFPFGSPSNRFFIVNRPVTYACAPTAGTTYTGTLRRVAGYAIQAAQPTNLGGAPLSAQTGANNALLAGPSVANPLALRPYVSACSFAYNNSASSRNGIVTVQLTLTSSGENVTLLQQIHVGNSP